MKAVISGIGVVSPFGMGKEIFCEGLFHAQSAVRRIKDFLDIGVRLAAPVPGFLLPHPALKRLDRSIQFAISATEEALKDAKLDGDEEMAVIVSSSKGGVVSFEREHKRLLSHSPLSFDAFECIMPHAVSSWIKRFFSMKKAVLHSFVSACTTGLTSIIKGAQLVEEGNFKLVLCGATEASLTPLIVAGFQRMGVLSKRSSHSPSPFDKRRDGFVIAEGAAVFVLEEREHALRRGARVYGQIFGYAQGSCPKGIVSFKNDAESVCSIMKKAMKNAGLDASSIDYVACHGTGTLENDAVESLAMKKVFGPFLHKVYVSSQKSMIGHALGASGAVELAGALLAREAGFLPPTINLLEPDLSCCLNHVQNRRKECKFNVFAKLSFGFGGHICCIILGDADSGGDKKEKEH